MLGHVPNPAEPYIHVQPDSLRLPPSSLGRIDLRPKWIKGIPWPLPNKRGVTTIRVAVAMPNQPRPTIVNLFVVPINLQ